MTPAQVRNAVERFLLYCAQQDGKAWNGTRCWIWTGGKSRGGNRWSEQAFYGTFNPGGSIRGGVRAHVFIAWLTGIIPDLKVPPGKNLDHCCRNALCCNPEHLELIDALENQRRKRHPLPDPMGGYVRIAYAPPGSTMECPF